MKRGGSTRKYTMPIKPGTRHGRPTCIPASLLWMRITASVLTNYTTIRNGLISHRQISCPDLMNTCALTSNYYHTQQPNSKTKSLVTVLRQGGMCAKTKLYTQMK